jgi:hypothetical protein
MSFFPTAICTALAATLTVGNSAGGQTGAASSTPVDHATMTPEQHAAMHGGVASKASSDSAFAAMQARGKMAMGVDQYESAHRFDVLPDGGRIALEMNANDSLSITQIRAHLKLIEHAFEAGDFTTPAFVHMRSMPGTATMARRKAVIKYSYADLERGGEVRITSRDPRAIAAIHEFLEAQRAEHRSGGATR